MYDKVGVGDLQQLFHKSVVRYDKEPVFVASTGERGELFIKSIGDNRIEKVVKVTDEKFDFSPVPLGFCNADGAALFLYRRPYRQYKVGLDSNTLGYANITRQVNPHTVQAITRFTHKGFKDCVMGVYPSLEEAFNLLEKKEIFCVGINRNFAIDKDHKLFFRDKTVGIMNEDGKPTFFHTKSYLKALWEN